MWTRLRRQESLQPFNSPPYVGHSGSPPPPYSPKHPGSFSPPWRLHLFGRPLPRRHPSLDVFDLDGLRRVIEDGLGSPYLDRGNRTLSMRPVAENPWESPACPVRRTSASHMLARGVPLPVVHWKDEKDRPWEAAFSLSPNARQPLISAVSGPILTRK